MAINRTTQQLLGHLEYQSIIALMSSLCPYCLVRHTRFDKKKVTTLFNKQIKTQSDYAVTEKKIVSVASHNTYVIYKQFARGMKQKRVGLINGLR